MKRPPAPLPPPARPTVDGFRFFRDLHNVGNVVAVLRGSDPPCGYRAALPWPDAPPTWGTIHPAQIGRELTTAEARRAHAALWTVF